MTRGKAALIAVQPGLAPTEKVSICVEAAEICRNTTGQHAGMKLEYLRKIQELGHLSIFEHARYCSPQWINRNRREYGRANAEYMESVNARYVIENDGYNPVFKFGIKDVDYHKMTNTQKMVHASATFVIICSRVCSHQIVRHRTGSFSQQSQRHVKATNGSNTWYHLPEKIAGDQVISLWYEFLHNKAAEFSQCAEKRGVPLEDIRYILSGATKTKLMATMTFENWVKFINARTSQAAQEEIREIAFEIKHQLINHDYDVFKGAFDAT